MAKILLNKANSIQDPSTVYPQAQMDQVVFDVLAGAAGGQNGVVSGCAVTAQGVPDGTVAVASGTIVIAGTSVVVSSGNVTMTAADITNPRKDLITVNSSGTKAYTAGTAASAPVWPSIPANSIVLAWVYVAANDNVINSNQIVDCRITVASPITGGSLWTTVSKAADESRNTTTTLAVDSTLKFTMSSNTKYRIRGTVHATAVGASGFKYGFNGPAIGAGFIHGTKEQTRDSDAAWATGGYTAYDTTGTNLNLAGGGSTGFGTIRFDFIVHNGATGGDFQFTWAQNSSVGTNTTVRAGSQLEYAVA